MSHSPTEILPASCGVPDCAVRSCRVPSRIAMRMPSFTQFLPSRIGLAGLLAAIAIVGGVGCGVGKPNLAHPGDIQSQRFNAVAHDPYTDTDAGPEVVGGRPRDFQKNLAEPVRNRWLMDSWWSRR